MHAKSSLMRQASTYILAIALGVILAVSTVRVLPCQAAPIAEDNPSIQAKAPITSNSFVTAAVNRVGSAVVRIDTERTVTRQVPEPFLEDPFFRRFFGDGFSQQMPSETLRGLGSGVIIDPSGEILTNAHVVNQADRVTVQLKDGRTFEGTVQGVDEVSDLAVVKIDAGGDVPVAPLGDSSTVQVGDWAIAVGNPLGLDNTVTLGIVSTLKRSSREVGIFNKRLEFIQTDAAINPGNSGGPLLNERGEVIGINTAIRADAMGIGFAIPIDKAKAIKDQLMRGEKIAHPFLGVQMVTVTPQLAKQNNSDPNSPIDVPEISGVLVVRVVPNSPAAAGGIRRGDVIVQVDRQPVATAEQLQSIVDNSQVGQVLQIKVQRNNKTQQLSVRTGELEDKY
ncbi:trypsin-like peptidase domain-containing protein [Gloeocapsopsis crepidinum LEGE 06123]|uniref:Trypsin-like peptidase domain-containing protein n=1 Tax=Gloeocapsopsis crepidinum LEGE 06123 TaxID=588587 RepID=A0ABR9URN8_9CHRO|nr:HhoA/HhoB/HtrA family serine endopeptidase [Gloeocapsopsis crepidinum]MBE9190730.1 trypsin-like peptidase domain-containing protein [Gloeocapsopsis crepidinum LEGE 06123]